MRKIDRLAAILVASVFLGPVLAFGILLIIGAFKENSIDLFVIGIATLLLCSVLFPYVIKVLFPYITHKQLMSKRQRMQIGFWLTVQVIVACILMGGTGWFKEDNELVLFLFVVVLLDAVPYHQFWKSCKTGGARGTKKLGYASLGQVDSMNGHEFERYCAKLLGNSGKYVSVKVTPGSGDFGADIFAIDCDGLRWVWQCKNYRAKLTNKPIQEVVASMAHYNADRAGVITNSTFTPAARQLANENGVKLIDRTYFI